MISAWAFVIIAAALGSALLHVRGERRGARARVYVFKPLTTALLLILALLLPTFRESYRVAVAAGLLASLAGDVWLMLPRDRFIAGLASFLIAHLAYLVAFTRAAGPGSVAWPFLVYGFAAAVLLALLWPRLGALRIPVLIYATALALMAGQAGVHAATLATVPARLAAAGAGLFVLSDSVLAFDRFHTRFRDARTWVTATYVPAQLFIALSVLP